MKLTSPRSFTYRSSELIELGIKIIPCINIELKLSMDHGLIAIGSVLLV